jgi:hypothetical protein
VNVTVITSVPTGASAAEHDPVKFESAAEHRFTTGDVPVVNATVPVGVPPPGDMTATVAE